MTIKTLEHIHKLLIEEERKTREVYKGSRRLQHEYEENGAPKDLIKRQEKAADEYMHEHSAAADALNDFESHKW